MALEFWDLLKLAPYGHPMALVDRVLSIEAGSSIVAIKVISGTELCYRGVPPGASARGYAYPVSLMMESLLQSAVLLWFASGPPCGDGTEQVLLLGAVRGFRLEGRGFPGDVITHRVHVEKATSGNIAAAGESWIGDRRVVTVDSIVASIRPRTLVSGSGAWREPSSA
jgi:3-hydroxyacyl-[acyl-carrier-protein] dehydratase